MKSVHLRLPIFVLVASIFVLADPGLVLAGTAEQTPKKRDSHSILADGVDCFCNNDYASAEEKFNEYMKLEPADPVGIYRVVLNLYVWLRQKQKVDDPKIVDDSSYRELLRLIQDGYLKAEVQKRRGKEVAFHLSIQASLDSLRALFEHGKGDSTGAASFKKAVEEAIETDKLGSPYGTYLLGQMHYRIGERVAYQRWALDFTAHLRFQRNKGIEMIFSVPSKVRSDFACEVWSSIFQIVAKEDKNDLKKYLTPEVIRGLQEFVIKYPNNKDVQDYSLYDKLPRKR